MVAEHQGESDREVLRAWGAVVHRYRHWKQLSRRELAARAGLSPVFLGEIERGEKDASSHTVLRLAAALDVSLAELYHRVAMRLDGASGEQAGQTSLPPVLREDAAEYLDGVPPAYDETALDLYRIARQLRSDQQVALLILAQALTRESKS